MKEYDIFQKDIYQDEIWQQSACLDHEEQVNQTIFGQLRSLGFQSTDDPKRWKRGDQTVLVCLVDDVRSLSTDYHTDLPYLFDPKTTIITDNWLTCPSRFRVHRLPNSFLGIYSHQPQAREWQPDRNFSFSVNRIDVRRMLLMLELGWRQHVDKGYVNFNCLKRHSGSPNNSNSESSAAVWNHMWEFDLSAQQREQYQGSHDLLSPRMPLKNYDISHDDIHIKSLINIVVETYSGDNNITISEKLIRVLVAPAPWTVYAGRYTVAYLESLGFDCLSDLIDHNHYDRLKEVEDKVHVFIWKSLQEMRKIRDGDRQLIANRCRRAADHNIQLLAQLRGRWNQDWADWLKDLPTVLST